MTLAKMLVLCAVVALLPLVAEAQSDTCYNSQLRRRTLPGACPGNCCINDNCGSSSECRRALIIGLTIGGVLLLCCCIAAGVVFCYCTKACCFESKEDTTVEVVTQQAGPQQTAPDHVAEHAQKEVAVVPAVHPVGNEAA